MRQYLFIVYFTCIVISTLTGIIRYRKIDSAMRVLVILLITITFSELTSRILLNIGSYETRYVLFHISSVLELILVSAFFLEFIRPVHKRILSLINLIVWPLVGMLNILFLQPINTLNSNMLMLECFCIISMSLYSIYHMLKYGQGKNIFRTPHFWVATLWLLLWSATFFFWAFIQILYNSNWKYKDVPTNIHYVVNIITYSGFALVLFFYPKMKKHWIPLK